MVLGDHNPLFTYGVVKRIQGKYRDSAEITFDADEGGFNVLLKEGNWDHYISKGEYVTIFKTLSGAEKATRKRLGV